MFRLTYMLRLLLIVAFCLDGSATVWQASAMAESMARHGSSSGHGGHVEQGQVASAEDCEDEDGKATGQGTSSQEACDCDSTGCECPFGFTTFAVACGVPFAAQHRLVALPTMPDPTAVVRSSLASVFRPPIG